MVKNLAYGGPGCSWTKNFAAQGTLNAGQPCASHEQPGEPGPRGGVGEGKSKYLRYLDSKRIPSTRLEARGLENQSHDDDDDMMI